MVHLHHTPTANATVMRSWCFDHVAVFAPAEFHETLEHIVFDAVIMVTFFECLADSFEAFVFLLGSRCERSRSIRRLLKSHRLHLDFVLTCGHEFGFTATDIFSVFSVLH